MQEGWADKNVESGNIVQRCDLINVCCFFLCVLFPPHCHWEAGLVNYGVCPKRTDFRSVEVTLAVKTIETDAECCSCIQMMQLRLSERTNCNLMLNYYRKRTNCNLTLNNVVNRAELKLLCFMKVAAFNPNKLYINEYSVDFCNNKLVN